MHCPTCNNQALVPTKLEQSLPAMSCKRCSGILLSILSYRDWLDDQPQLSPASVKSLQVDIDNTDKVITCTKCRKLMTKYKISADFENQVDLCLDCADVWFDFGEWDLLGQLGLQDHFTTIFNTPWQTKIREEKFQRQYLDDLQDKLGMEDFSSAKDFKAWLHAHKHKEFILHFLRKGFESDK